MEARETSPVKNVGRLSRLSLILPIVTLSVSLGIGLIFAVGLALKQGHEWDKALASTIDDVVESNAQSLSQMLWAYDREGVRLSIEGMVRAEAVRSVVVEGVDDFLLDAGKPTDGQQPYRVISLVHKQQGGRSEIKIGELRIFVDEEFIYDRVVNQATRVIVVVLLSAAMSAVAIFLVLRNVIVRPLSEITQQLSVRSDDQHYETIYFGGRAPPDGSRNEIEQMVDALNRARERANHLLDELRYNEERFRHFAESASDGFWEMKEDSSFSYVSDEVMEIMGLRADDIIGKTHGDMVKRYQREDRADWDIFLKLIEKRRSFSDFEMQWRRPDGEVRFLSFSGLPRFDLKGEFLGYRGVARDITDRKKAEEELERHRDHLRELVEDRTRELEKAKEVADRANAAKSDFLAKMSHELRTPLNSIIGLSEMLYEDAVEFNDENYKEPLQRVHRAGQHLLDLINDILDISKIEAGKMELALEEASLKPLLGQVMETVAPLAEQFGNRLEAHVNDDIGTLRTDATRLRQVLLNLLGNACKFTENGRVSLSANSYEKDTGRWIVLEVSDTGIGIPKNKIGNLFADFSQIDSKEARKRMGTGLGLSISARIVELMKGSLAVESVEGEGSTFTIELPCDPTKIKDWKRSADGSDKGT